MLHQDQYQQFYQQIAADIEKCKAGGHRIVLGYTSDLDVLIEWDDETFSRILDSFLKDEPSVKEGDVVSSMEDFARIVSYYAMNGLGGEVDITGPAVCEYLKNHFKHCFALGGTCAQGATALSTLGFPIIAHISDRSREVCQLMDQPGLDLVTNEGLVPIMQGISGKPPVLHIIFQYPKGAKLRIKGKVFEVPLSNRLIMGFDTMHKYLFIDRSFIDYCERHARDIYCYSISGFNAIIDKNIMLAKMDELCLHYQTIKERNPDCIIYLESACYLNSDVEDLVFERLSSYIDILGINEDELINDAKRFGHQTDKDDLLSVLSSLQLLVEKYPVKGFVLHTKDYSMYYGSKIGNVDMAKGLTLGNLMSATRARIGQYGSFEDCGDSLSLPLSPTGVSFAERLEGMSFDKYVKLVPSRYIENPKCTIGLGDTFMAGVLISFVK
ncbi:MAG: ADP-dependent glucokinase/phosphofructokinase [Flexilinea sp.]